MRSVISRLEPRRVEREGRASTSASTAVAPAASIPATVGTHVFAAVITSSPCRRRRAASAIVIASVPDATPSASRDAAVGGELLLEPRDRLAEDEPAAVEHAREAASSSPRMLATWRAQVEERDVHVAAQ